MSSFKKNMKKQGEKVYKSKDESGMSFDSHIDIKKFNLEKMKLKSPETKDYLIDLLPYQIKTDKHPNRKKGDFTYHLDIWTHNLPTGGSCVCMKKTFDQPCKICERFLKHQNEGLQWDDIKHLYPQRRNIYLIKYNDKKLILDQAFRIFEENWLGAVQRKEKKGEDVFPVYSDEKGCTSLEFTVKPKGQYYEIINFDFPEITDFDKSFLENNPSLEELLVIPDQDKIKRILDADENENYVDNKEKENEENEENEEENTTNEDYYKEVVENEDQDENEEKQQEIKSEEPIKKKKKKKEENIDSCPKNLVFGKDWDDYENCDDCQNETPHIYEACEKKHKEL